MTSIPCFMIGCMSALALQLLFLTNQRAAAAERGQQRISEEPQDTRALRGDSVTLKCRVENQAGPVTWIKDGFALGSDRDLRAYERYSMVGSSADGEYNLQITNVDLSDDAVYQCQLLQTATAEGKISKAVRMTVLVAPSPPRFVNFGDMITGIEGREFTIGCLAERGKPPATISWVIAGSPDGGNGLRQLGNVTEVAPTDGVLTEGKKKKNGKKGLTEKKEKSDGESVDGGKSDGEVQRRDSVREEVTKEDQLYTVRSNLRYTPQPRDDGKYLVCLVKHEAVEAKMATAAQLIIEYAPRVTVYLNTTGVLKEGGRGTLVCDVDAKPSDNLQYAWRKDGNILPRGQNNPVLQLSEGDLRRENQGSIYECEALNSVGTRKDQFTLDLEYPPVINIRDKQVPVDVGQTALLHCEADSNPPANLEWFRKENQYSVLSREENYTLPNIKDWQAGAYVCKAKAPGFPAVSEEVAVYIKGPPSVLMPSTVEVSNEEAYTSILCEVRGFPRPDSIRWYKGDTLIQFSTSGRFEQKQMPQKNAVVSILKIKHPQSEDFASYKCEAKNARGIGSGETRMVTAYPIPLYVLIPGIIGGCVGIMLVILCCIQCNRKSCRSKNTTISDDHSDVTVKVEALDGSGLAMDYFPDMYGSSQPLENGVYSGKDYIALPQDNPDVDLLPPPYSSYVNQSASTFLAAPANQQHPSAGHVVHMTYLNGDVTDPNRNNTYAVYGDYGDYGQHLPASTYYDSLRANGNYVTAARNYGNDLYYSMSGIPQQMANGGGILSPGAMAPLATLEPVQEVTTPEENSRSTSVAGAEFNRPMSRAHESPSNQRSAVIGQDFGAYGNVIVTSSGSPTQQILIPRVHNDGSTNV